MDPNSKKSPENFKNEVKDLFGYSLDEFELVNSVQVGDFKTGDFGIFRYVTDGPWNKDIDQQFFVFCVSNERSGSGATFKSTRENKLLSCFRIDHLSHETIAILSGSLHRVKAKYKRIPLIGGYLMRNSLHTYAKYSNIITVAKLLIGKNNYRTFVRTKMSDITAVNVKFLEEGKTEISVTEVENEEEDY